MQFKKVCTLVILFLSFTILYAQEDVLVLDPLQDVDVQLVADTTTNHGILPNRVYQLERNEVYFQSQIFNVPPGSTLRFRAEADTGAKPVIYLEINSSGRPPGNWVVLNGGNLEVKDICIVGYDEFDWDNGLANIQGGLINTTVAGSTILLDGVILSNVNGQPVRCGASVAKLQITNCIFANMGALTRSNFGAGKGIDLREVAHDTVIVVNTTFVNYQDRVIRHLTLGSAGENPGAIKYLLFDHNTIVNGMAFHGMLSLGSVGDQVILTNNLFVDAFALGEDSTDAVRSAEWLNTGEKYPNGNNRMTWVLSVPNDQTQWTVSGNYYAVSPEGQAWQNSDHFGHGPWGPGTPLSWHINSKIADSTTAFNREDGIVLNNRPNLMINLMNWYEDPALGNRQKPGSSPLFNPALHDMDRRRVEYYRDTLDAAYSTDAAAYKGAESCLPAGDLNWFPEKKAEWEAGTAQCFTPLITVDGNKDDFYTALEPDTTDAGYIQLRSYAYSTTGVADNDADLSAKVWTAWDANWFYLYTEVKDDIVSFGTTSNPWETDNLEIKFDPEPTDSNQAGSGFNASPSIWDTRLTALDGTEAQKDTMDNVPADSKQFARRLTSDGYVLELGLKWQAIMSTNGETISNTVDSVFGMVINIHDNDGAARVATVMWAARLDDAAWNRPNYFGTVKFLADGKLQFIKVNNMTGITHPVPYNGSDYIRVGVNDDKSLLPKSFSLSQNYPNPFNPSTIIKFALPKEAAVELSVYNLLGQKVVDLINTNMPAGYHQAVFNASSFSSGVYFYRIKAGSFVQTKKLMILK